MPKIKLNSAHIAAALTYFLAMLGAKYFQPGSIDLSKLGPWAPVVGLVIALVARSVIAVPAAGGASADETQKVNVPRVPPLPLLTILTFLGMFLATSQIAATCTPAQQTAIEGGIFSEIQTACLVIEAPALVAQTNAVTQLEKVCTLAPSLQPYITNFINSLLAQQAAKAAGAKSSLFRVQDKEARAEGLSEEDAQQQAEVDTVCASSDGIHYVHSWEMSILEDPSREYLLSLTR